MFERIWNRMHAQNQTTQDSEPEKQSANAEGGLSRNQPQLTDAGPPLNPSKSIMQSKKLKMLKKISCPMKKLAVLPTATALILGLAGFCRHFCPSHPKHIWISGTKRYRMQVQVGQRYFQTLAFVSYNEVWRVTSICSDGERIRHARLVNVRNTSETKTLSCSALDGRYGFRLLNV